MANTVSIEFSIDAGNEGRNALRDIDNQLNQIGRTAKQSGAVIDSANAEIVRSSTLVANQAEVIELKLRRLTAVAQLYKVEITQANISALRSQGVEAIDKQIASIEKQVEAQRRLTNEKKETLKVDRQVEAALARMKAQQARTEVISRESSFTGPRALQFAAPEVAASTALERTTKGLNAATEGTKKLNRGAAELRQTLFSLSGVPFPEAANQLSKLLGTSLSGSLAIAGIAAVGAAAVEASQQVREKAEADLKRIQSLVNTGLTGGLESRNEQLDKLQKVLQASREASVIGQNPNPTIRGQLATEVKENDIKKAAREAAQVFTAVFDEQLAKSLFGDPQKLFVGIQNQRDLENQINAILQQRQKIEDALGITQANRLKLAREQKKAEEDVLETATQVFAQLVREHEEAGQARIKAQQSAQITIAQLEKQSQTNPLLRIFDDAAVRADQFRKQFPEIGEDLFAAFDNANNKIKNLDIFRGALGTANNLNTLLRQRAELSEGGPTFVASAQREAREAQLQQAQEFLRIAENAAQRQLALENIISATSDVGSLNSEQKDLRRQALDEQIGLQKQLLKEQFDSLKNQTAAQQENTFALVTVGNRLAQVEGALTNFADKPISIVVEEGPASNVNLGSVQATN